MPLTKDNLCQIAMLFLDAFDKLSAEAHLALRADTCIHIFAPSSLGVPTKSNEQFASHLNNNIKSVLAAFPVTAKETHIHLIPTGGQITMWATGIPHFKEEAKCGEEDEVWTYMGEYIFMLDIDDQGKIERVLEFLDSKEAEKLRGLMIRAKLNVGMDGKAW